MNKFIRNNQKKLLAVFTALLMIVFIATMGPSGTRDRFAQNVVIGNIGGEKVMSDDVRRAEGEWELLSRRIVYHVQQSGPIQQQWQPLAALAMPQEMAMAMANNVETYYLLQAEARKMGLAPQFDAAREQLSGTQMGVLLPDNRVVPLQNAGDSRYQAAIVDAVANLLMVRGAFVRVAESVKISDPMLQHQLAQQLQQIKVRVVDFPAKEDDQRIGTPTTEQLQEHFARFADVEKDATTSAANPFGFGYKYPNRVKIQYIAIPRAEVRKAVQAARDEYDWDVEANRYYLQHQSEFPSTQPAATQEAFTLGPTTGKAAPTIRPLSEVKGQVLSRLQDPLIDRLQNQIQTELLAKLNADYEAWQKANPPTTGPTTNVASDSFAGFEYLQKLGQEMQAKHKVTLTIASIADTFKTVADLRELPGIGKVQSFPEMATIVAEPFVPAEQRSSPMVMSLLEPSRAMYDESRDSYVYRIVAADPAHKPAALDEVKTLVEKDWRKIKAFELAKADAQKLLDAAKEPGLDKVPGDRQVIMTGAFPMSDAFPIDNYKLSAKAQGDFVRQSYALLSTLTHKDRPRPIGLAEMPAEAKVAVVEVIYVESSVRPESQDFIKSIFSERIAQEFQSALSSNWFDYTSIAQRVGYQSDAATRVRPN